MKDVSLLFVQSMRFMRQVGGEEIWLGQLYGETHQSMQQFWNASPELSSPKLETAFGFQQPLAFFSKIAKLLRESFGASAGCSSLLTTGPK